MELLHVAVRELLGQVVAVNEEHAQIKAEEWTHTAPEKNTQNATFHYVARGRLNGKSDKTLFSCRENRRFQVLSEHHCTYSSEEILTTTFVQIKQ